jgi:hypothetical protein
MVEIVKVEECDRVAAANLIEMLASELQDKDAWLRTAESWRNGATGHTDRKHVAEAFARHRLAALSHRTDAGGEDWRCDQCGCRSYARVDEQKEDRSFGPGPFIRCVHCKKTALSLPPDRGAALREAATFLLDRLSELEFCDLEDTARDFYGHVDPAMGRLRAAISDGRA